MTAAQRTRVDQLAAGDPPTPEDVQFLLAELAHLDLCFSAAVHVALECATEAALERAWKIWDLRDQGETGTVQ
jgi:hypothetical protein